MLDGETASVVENFLLHVLVEASLFGDSDETLDGEESPDAVDEFVLAVGVVGTNAGGGAEAELASVGVEPECADSEGAGRGGGDVDLAGQNHLPAVEVVAGLDALLRDEVRQLDGRTRVRDSQLCQQRPS